MSDTTCKRFWEGAVGVALSPRKLANGSYFWTFSLVRSYKRNDKWEYTQHFGQKHAEALGRVMCKALQFIEQTDATAFVTESMAARAADRTTLSCEPQFSQPERLAS